MSLARVFPTQERDIMNPFNNVDPVLPVQNTRGNTSLADIYNHNTTQLGPLVKMINNPKNYAFARNITKNAKSYTDKGSFEEIFKSMGVVDNTIDPDSPEFKDGAIKLAYIRLIISGKIQYKQKAAFVNRIIGRDYKLSNSNRLSDGAKEDVKNVLELVEHGDITSAEFGHRGGLRTLAGYLLAFTGLSSFPIGIVGAAGANPFFGGFAALIIFSAAIIAITVNTTRYDKMIIINVLIKLLDAILISDESLLYALGSERIEQFPLLYDDPNSRAIYYKYVNELSKKYQKNKKISEFTADAGEHPTLSNFVSNDTCAICFDSLAQPYKKVMEVCSNHHRFHMICMKRHMEQYIKTHDERLFDCPLCRKRITEDVKNKLKDYIPPSDIIEGGSKKKHRRKSKTRKYRK
jgi:hypothetical protein